MIAVEDVTIDPVPARPTGTPAPAAHTRLGVPPLPSAPSADVPARLYRPARSTAAPGQARGVVWAHGGGFIEGDLDMAEGDWVARRFASAGHTVVSVDYRLVTPSDLGSGVADPAATNRFPAAHDDMRAALHWLADNASAFGVEADRLVLGGASAGANLAAGVALRAVHDAHTVSPTDLFLAYPVLHAPLPDHDEAVAAAVGQLPAELRFEPEIVELMNINYVGDPQLLRHPFAYPGGHDLAGLPRTLIVNSERDDLRSSGEAFGRELTAAGVDATTVYEPGTTHGHLNDPDAPHSERTMATVDAWLAHEPIRQT